MTAGPAPREGHIALVGGGGGMPGSRFVSMPHSPAEPADPAVSSPAAAPAPPAPVPAAPGPRPRRRIPPRLLVLVPAVAIGALTGAGLMPGLTSPDAGRAAALGLLLGINLTLLTLRVLAPWSGMAVVWSSVGVGRWLGSTVLGGRLLVFRLLPLVPLSACLVIRDRPGLRWRLWAATACSALVEAATAAALILAGGTAAHVGLGVAAASACMLLIRPGRATSRFWFLFRLPRAGQEALLAEWTCDDATVTAARLLAAGRLGPARQALDAAPGPRPQRRRATGAALAVAEGRYDEGAREAYELVAESRAPQLRAAALQTYATALADGVRTGHWPPEEALPRFAAVMAALRKEFPGVLRVSDLGALDALLSGRPDRAVRLARSAAMIAPEVLSRARALSALGAAQNACGRPGEAVASFARAAALTPGLATLPRRV